MIGGIKQGGFTIVEVMMFLAISGALFVIAALTIGGKQEQAQFAQGIRDLQSKIEDITNDVITGYFPQSSYSCNYNGASGQPITFSGAISAEQGAHEDCIFLGKVLHFTQNSGLVSVISVAGSRADAQGIPVNSFAKAHPLAVDGSGSSPDMTDIFKINGGLVVTGILQSTGSGPILRPAAFGIFSSLPRQGLNVTSGALTASTVTIPNSLMTTDTSLSATSGRINQMDVPPTPILNPVIAICLSHGVGGKRAALIVGSRGRQPYAETKIDDIDSATSGVPAIMAGEVCP